MELNGFWPCIGICWLVMKGLAPPMGIWPPIILLLGICCDMKGFPIPMFYCPIIYYYCIKAVLYWFCMAWAIMLVIMFCCCCWCVWNDDMSGTNLRRQIGYYKWKRFYLLWFRRLWLLLLLIGVANTNVVKTEEVCRVFVLLLWVRDAIDKEIVLIIIDVIELEHIHLLLDEGWCLLYFCAWSRQEVID